MNEQTVENDTQPKRFKRIYLVILVVLMIILASSLVVYLREQKALKITRYLAEAKAFMQQGDCVHAIPILTNVIAIDSNNVDAYYKRAACYAQTPSNVFTEQQGNFVNALHDLDKLIILEPNVGDYYAYRDNIFSGLAEMANESASKVALYELALDNSEKAMQLGVSKSYSSVYQHHARDLIRSNHCKEGLMEIQNLINQSKPDDPNMDNYNIYLTEAYLCLGDLEKAHDAALKIQCNDPVSSCRTMYLLEIYIQAGVSENVLDILNYLINSEPTYGGWRYFMRALLYYQQGEKDLALQDLATGDNYTWYGDGVYWYVKARMAFDDGDNQNGMLYLQYAESTLDVQYTLFRQKILKELTARGGSPLVVTPQIPLATTPIP